VPTYRNKPIDHVIDVRTKLEFWLGHVKGADCIPVDRLEQVLQERTDIDDAAARVPARDEWRRVCGRRTRGFIDLSATAIDVRAARVVNSLLRIECLSLYRCDVGPRRVRAQRDE